MHEAKLGDRGILVAHDASEDYQDLIAARFPGLPVTYCRDADALAEGVARIAPRVVFSVKCPKITGPQQRAILGSPNLRWVQVGGAGVDHLHPWPESVTVTNAAGILSPFMSEYVLGAILMSNCGLQGYLHQMAEKDWTVQPWTSVVGKTLLIIGLGRIGRLVAARAKSAGLRVLGAKGRPEPVENVDHVLAPEEIHAALPEADFVALHAPLTPETRGLVDGEFLACMKPSALLINCSRGGLVDETALIAALEERRIGGAVLDVFETEPLPAESPLWELKNVLVTPHMSDSVADWPRRFAAYFCDNLDRWLAGEELLNQVNRDRGY